MHQSACPKKLFELAELQGSTNFKYCNLGICIMQRSVVFFGQAPIHVEPCERALDNPAPDVDAEIGFPHQYVCRFPDPDAVALGQVLAENTVKGTVHENDLDDSQQFVRGGYLVPESNGSGPGHRVGGQHPNDQHLTQRVGEH